MSATLVWLCILPVILPVIGMFYSCDRSNMWLCVLSLLSSAFLFLYSRLRALYASCLISHIPFNIGGTNRRRDRPRRFASYNESAYKLLAWFLFTVRCIFYLSCQQIIREAAYSELSLFLLQAVFSKHKLFSSSTSHLGIKLNCSHR